MFLPGTFVYPKTFAGLLVFIGILGVVGIVLGYWRWGPQHSITFEVASWILCIGLILVGWRRSRRRRSA